MNPRFLGAASFFVFAGLSTASAGVVPSFRSLGDQPGGVVQGTATGVSDDGSVAIGFSGGISHGHIEAFRWSAADGIVGLGLLPGQSESYARAASADGSVIVGNSESRPFRWTAATGPVFLGDLPGGGAGGEADGVNDSGDVVVGNSSSNASGPGHGEAFLWTPTTGLVGLRDLPGGVFDSYATAVTSDGSVVVGTGSSAQGRQAFRWTSDGGMVGLGYLPGGGNQSYATDVSADGSVVVGYGNSSLGLNDAFRWTAADGMVSLGSLAGGTFNYTQALATSADGNVIVGLSYVDTQLVAQPFLWTPSEGIRSLRDILTNDYGIDLTGWVLADATDISADGRTIVGNGFDPAGNTVGWIATIPEPATGTLALLASGLLICRRRRVRVGRHRRADNSH